MNEQDEHLEDQQQRLQNQYTELAQIAGSLAHEIKNPLSVIRMNMDLLAEDFAGAETLRERRALKKIDLVHDQCGRLENLLNDFLRFTRVSGLQLEPGSLNDQVDRVLEFFAPQAEENDVEVIRYLDPDLPRVLMDSESLQSALVNLVKNALESMPEGGELMARTYVTQRRAALDLIDTGCGMDQQTALKMFDTFFSTKQGGSGLGLPMARKVIEGHGARIDVQSAVGRGTKFTLEFPLPARLTDASADG